MFFCQIKFSDSNSKSILRAFPWWLLHLEEKSNQTCEAIWTYQEICCVIGPPKLGFLHHASDRLTLEYMQFRGNKLEVQWILEICHWLKDLRCLRYWARKVKIFFLLLTVSYWYLLVISFVMLLKTVVLLYFCFADRVLAVFEFLSVIQETCSCLA